MSYQLIDFRRKILRHPTRKWSKQNDVSKIFLHTTASDNQDPNNTARYHITPGPNNHLSAFGAPSIAYHDFITKAGVVYHCNNYNESTWHTKGSNKNSVGICLAFKGQDGVMPVQEQWDALMEHLVELCLNFKVLPQDVKGHREAPGFSFFSNGSVKYKKVCPGMGIDLDEMRHFLTLGLQQRLFDENLYASKIDGDFGPKSTEALMAYIPNSEEWPYETNL